MESDCYVLPPDISNICEKSDFHCKKKKKKLLLKYLAGLGGSVVFLVFSLCGENDLKYLILISDYFESVLEIDFLL